MTNVLRGFRDKLENHVDIANTIPVRISVSGNSEYDFCCFGVDGNDTLSDDRYMVFFNQTESPNREIVLKQQEKEACFELDLRKLPLSVNKLVFTVNIDGNDVMGNISSLELIVGNNALSLYLQGKDFQNEKAVIAIEIYKKDIWRIAFIARGFDGGLSELLKVYGGEEVKVAAENAQTPIPSETVKVSLEKILEKEAPQLVSLAKPLKVSLDKHNLNDVVARVGLVLDLSGSMFQRYNNGTVQEIVNKTVPLAVQFDDDGELDLWFFGTTPKRMNSVNTKNYMEAVPKDWKGLMRSLGGNNNEPEVMRLIIDEYKNSSLPAYVLFISDGGVHKTGQIKKMMIEASNFPIFWQFVGVGGINYGVLEDLDSMDGRYVDNANFFALDDFQIVPDKELYDRLLNEFPSWLKEITNKKMIK